MKGARVIVDCFVDGEGSAKVGARIWRWEFHEYLGPTFVNKKGESVMCPSEQSPVWDEFNHWLWNYYVQKKDRRALNAMAAWYTPRVAEGKTDEHGR